jgi:hypothetical protein
MRYELKPLGVGGTLDQTIAIFKDRFGLLVMILLLLRLPTTLILQYLVLTKRLDMPLQPTDAQTSEFFASLIRLYLVVILPFLILDLFVVSPITNGALIHATAQIYLGKSTSLRESLRFALGRYFPLVWTSLLFSLIIGGGTALCILPGILLFFRYALAVTVTALERVSGFGALHRSRILMHTNRTKNYNALFLLLVVLAFIQGGINGGSSLIPQVHLQALSGAVFGSIAYSFSIIALVVFYFSCRCQAEAFDLMHLAYIVAETPPDAPVLQSQE